MAEVPAQGQHAHPRILPRAAVQDHRRVVPTPIIDEHHLEPDRVPLQRLDQAVEERLEVRLLVMHRHDDAQVDPLVPQASGLTAIVIHDAPFPHSLVVPGLTFSVWSRMGDRIAN